MRWLISLLRREPRPRPRPKPAHRVVIMAWGAKHEVYRHLDPIRLLANVLKKAK